MPPEMPPPLTPFLAPKRETEGLPLSCHQPTAAPLASRVIWIQLSYPLLLTPSSLQTRDGGLFLVADPSSARQRFPPPPDVPRRAMTRHDAPPLQMHPQRAPFPEPQCATTPDAPSTRTLSRRALDTCRALSRRVLDMRRALPRRTLDTRRAPSQRALDTCCAFS
jgi:hypothetical protein